MITNGIAFAIALGIALGFWGLFCGGWASKKVQELEKELQECKEGFHKRLTELEKKLK